MATSRTGTAVWKRVSARAIKQAQSDGLTHCPVPRCGIELDYLNRKAPNGASVDHVLAHANGGADHIDNTQVICVACNSRKGKGAATTVDANVNLFPHSCVW